VSRRRRPERKPDYGISAAAMDLWRLCCEILHEVGEDSEAFRILALELHSELGLRPWNPIVFDIDILDDDPPDEPDQRASWEVSHNTLSRIIMST
jgi:hypothetical protein